MTIISIRLKDEVRDKAKQLAEENNMSLAEYLRQIIEDELAKNETDAEQNHQQPIPAHNAAPPNAAAELDAQKKPEKLLEHKRNLEFFIADTSALLRVLVRESGYFSPEKAEELLIKAQLQTTLYMKRYEKQKEEDKEKT